MDASQQQQQLLNIKRWNILYPVYINSKKTVAEGRRIGAAKACENPTCLEIGDCCNYLKIPFAIEIDKAYPRDFMQRGRVRVCLKKDDGSLYNPAISSSIANNQTESSAVGTANGIVMHKIPDTLNRKHLMLRVAELVPKHPGRVKKQETTKKQETSAKPSASTASGTSKSGKGGKKKK